jgi:hypothetical protein
MEPFSLELRTIDASDAETRIIKYDLWAIDSRTSLEYCAVLDNAFVSTLYEAREKHALFTFAHTLSIIKPLIASNSFIIAEPINDFITVTFFASAIVQTAFAPASLCTTIEDSLNITCKKYSREVARSFNSDDVQWR